MNPDLTTTRAGAAPASPDGYAVTPPPELASVFKSDHPRLAALRHGAHRLGVTQEQFGFFLRHHFDAVMEIAAGMAQLDEKEATAELRRTWPAEADFRLNTGLALRAVQALGGDLAEAAEQQFGNRPLFIRLMARLGEQVRTSPLIGGDPDVRAEEAKDLILMPAYRDKTHPEHAAVRERVDAFFGVK